MRRKRKILNLPFLRGISSEESSHLAIADGKNVTLLNCRPYKGQQIRRYGDKLLSSVLSGVTPLGLFYYELGTNLSLFMPTNDGNLYAVSSPFSASWASIGSGFSVSATSWQSCKFLNAIDNKTYAVFTNAIDDLQFYDGTTLTPLRQISAVNNTLGDSTTQIAVTNPSGTNWTYTFTGVGTDPGLGTGSQSIGDLFTTTGFSTNNNVAAAPITAVGTNSVTVVKAAGTAETKTSVTLQAGTSAPNRPTKAGAIVNYGGMLIAANLTALKPFIVAGDTEHQISEITLYGVNPGTDLYWELLYNSALSSPDTMTPVVLEINYNELDSFQWSLSGVTTVNAPLGKLWFTVSSASWVAPNSSVTVNVYSNEAKTTPYLVATGTKTIPVRIETPGFDYNPYLSPYVIEVKGTASYTRLGDNTSGIIVSNPSGTRFRYTWDGVTGTNPNFGLIKVGDLITTTGFSNAGNNITALQVIDVTSTYFDVYNSTPGVAHPVAEINVTINHAVAPLAGTLTTTRETGGIGETSGIENSGTILVYNSPTVVDTTSISFGLYTNYASVATKVGEAKWSTTRVGINGEVQTLDILGVGTTPVTGKLALSLRDIDAPLASSRKIPIQLETDPMMVRWCDPYQPTIWNQFSYEKLPSSIGGIRGMVVVSGQLYFLCNNTMHRAILTGDSQFPLRFEYNVSPVGCPYPETAIEYLGHLQFMANDGSWRSFDGFKPEIIDPDVSSKLATAAPSCCGHNTRKAAFYFNNTTSGNKNKLIGCQNDLITGVPGQIESISSPVPTSQNGNFFDETHAHATSINKMVSTDGNIYTAMVNAGGTYVVALNDPSQASYDLTNTPITFEVETKDFIIGDRIEAHALKLTIYGGSASTAVNVTVSANGSALTTQSVILDEFGVDVSVETTAKTLSVDIASPTTVPVSFYVDRIEVELQNPRLR